MNQNIQYIKNHSKNSNTYKIALKKKYEIYSLLKKYIGFLELIKNNRRNLEKRNIKLNLKITYFVIFKISYSNCMVHIVDCKGNIIHHMNSGLLGFQGKQKSSRYAILALLNELIKYEDRLKPFEISVVFLGIVKRHFAFIINKIKTKFKIKIIKCYNMSSHNGCRPKKIRRLKNKHFSF